MWTSHRNLRSFVIMYVGSMPRLIWTMDLDLDLILILILMILILFLFLFLFLFLADSFQPPLSVRNLQTTLGNEAPLLSRGSFNVISLSSY